MGPIYDSKLDSSRLVSPFYVRELDRYQFDYTDLVYELCMLHSYGSILRSRIGPVILSQTDLGYRFRMLRLYESISRSRIGPTQTRPYRFRVRIRNAAIAGVHFTIQNWTLTTGAVQFTIENWTQPDRNTFSFIYKRTK